jgi:hypothetical protein
MPQNQQIHVPAQGRAVPTAIISSHHIIVTTKLKRAIRRIRRQFGGLFGAYFLTYGQE